MELVDIGAECLDRRFDFLVNKMIENMWRNGNYSAFGYIVTESGSLKVCLRQRAGFPLV